jgi:hypothetical protein
VLKLLPKKPFKTAEILSTIPAHFKSEIQSKRDVMAMATRMSAQLLNVKFSMEPRFRD